MEYVLCWMCMRLQSFDCDLPLYPAMKWQLMIHNFPDNLYQTHIADIIPWNPTPQRTSQDSLS